MQLLLFEGLIASVLGGMAIGLAYMLAGLLACTAGDLALAPPQWKLILVAGVGGLLGSLIDSLIGKAVGASSVLRIRIRRIRWFLGLLDPDPLVRGTDPALGCS
jgi:hypothetical protein